MLLLYVAVTFACTGDAFAGELTSHLERYNVAYMLALSAMCALACIILRGRAGASRLWNLFHNKPGHHIILFYVLTATLVLVNPMSDYRFLAGLDYMLIAGTLGLFFLPDTEGGRMLLILTLPLYALLAATRRTDHALMPLYPYLSLAAASFMGQAYTTLRGTPVFKSRRWLTLLAAAVLVLMLAYNDASTFILGSRLNREDIHSNSLLVEYLDQRVGDDDVVLAPSQVAHILPGRVTTLPEVSTYEGRPVMYYGVIPEDRFLYNVSLANVKYAVLDGSTPQWMLDKGLGPLMDRIRLWNGTKAGGYVVHSNPAKV